MKDYQDDVTTGTCSHLRFEFSDHAMDFEIHGEWDYESFQDEFHHKFDSDNEVYIDDVFHSIQHPDANVVVFWEFSVPPVYGKFYWGYKE